MRNRPIAYVTKHSSECVLTGTWCSLVFATNVAMSESDFYQECYEINVKKYCFRLYSNSTLNWTEASEFCAGKNLTLPVITDNATNSVFQQFINTIISSSISSSPYVWIGLRARNVNDNFTLVWTNGQRSG